MAKLGEILISNEVYEGVRADYPNAEERMIDLKGIGEPVRVYRWFRRAINRSLASALLSADHAWERHLAANFFIRTTARSDSGPAVLPNRWGIPGNSSNSMSPPAS